MKISFSCSSELCKNKVYDLLAGAGATVTVNNILQQMTISNFAAFQK